jgi:hypothetical protein
VRLPDPRAPTCITHSAEAILPQKVYQILAGYPDCNDAPELRGDLSRFQYAFTRRQAELPLEERPVVGQIAAAQTKRMRILNDYLVDLFIRTRHTVPAEVLLDADASDAPVHGHQPLSGYHGSYPQQQYLPRFVFDGASGKPLAAWLRPATVHASVGAADIRATIVTRLRAAWPDVPIQVRSDNGLAVPGLYDSCETHGLPYACGHATNPVSQRATTQALADLELYHHWYRHREPPGPRFESLPDYQADNWLHSRRIGAKVEVTPQGSQQRFGVTNLEEPAVVVYRDFYVQRGKVPAQPIGEMQNGLQADRLSACGCRANAFRLLVHTLADASWCCSGQPWRRCPRWQRRV